MKRQVYFYTVLVMLMTVGSISQVNAQTRAIKATEVLVPGLTLEYSNFWYKNQIIYNSYVLPPTVVLRDRISNSHSLNYLSDIGESNIDIWGLLGGTTPASAPVVTIPYTQTLTIPALPGAYGDSLVRTSFRFSGDGTTNDSLYMKRTLFYNVVNPKNYRGGVKYTPIPSGTFPNNCDTPLSPAIVAFVFYGGGDTTLIDTLFGTPGEQYSGQAVSYFDCIKSYGSSCGSGNPLGILPPVDPPESGTFNIESYPIDGAEATLTVSTRMLSYPYFMEVKRTFHIPEKAGNYFLFEKRIKDVPLSLAGMSQTHAEGLFCMKVVVPDYNSIVFYHEFDNEKLKNAEGLPNGRTQIASRDVFHLGGCARFSYYDAPAKICADGTKSTVIKFIDSTSRRCKDFEYAITYLYDGSKIKAGDPFVPVLGKLEIESESDDSVVFRYTHPSIVPNSFLEFSVKDMTGNLGKPDLVIFNSEYYEPGDSLVTQQNIQVYPTPVVMVHGYSANASSFETLLYYLKDNGWPSNLLWSIDYKPTNIKDYTTNRNVVGDGIVDALKFAIDGGCSAGKVAVVTHSMGSPLTRLYIQSPTYRNDVNRFIPITGVLNGSQIGNWLLDPNFPLGAAAQNVLPASDPFQGGAGSMAVHSFDNDVTLNGAGNLNRNIVPMHPIATTFTGTPIGGEELGWLASMGTTITVAAISISNDLVLKGVYNGELNDGCVPVSSMDGGILSVGVLATQASEYPGIFHAGAQDNPTVTADVKNLLLKDPASEYFYQNGIVRPAGAFTLDYTLSTPGSPFYTPPFYVSGLNWPTRLPTPPPSSRPTASLNASVALAQKMNSTLAITSPANNTTVSPDQEVTISVSGSADVSQLLLVVNNFATNPFVNGIASSSHTFTYKVPSNAIGQTKVMVMGFAPIPNDTVSVYVIDSVMINVVVPAALNGIEAFQPVYVKQGKQVSPIIFGNYADGVRRQVQGQPGIGYQTQNGAIASIEAGGNVKGIGEGKTLISVSYAGQTIEVPVTVLPKAGSATSSTGNGDGTTPKSNNVVKSYSLSQNYPNPFNPATRISFSLPSVGLVKLKVYDVLGRVVKVLVDEKRDAGRYEVSFDGSKLASGVYFYRLEVRSSGSPSGNFIQSRKMILVK